jgi:hypothetical protein
VDAGDCISLWRANTVKACVFDVSEAKYRLLLFLIIIVGITKDLNHYYPAFIARWRVDDWAIYMQLKTRLVSDMELAFQA